jgi:hypothetical protein
VSTALHFIVSLRLNSFNIGHDPTAITEAIKIGVSRLKSFEWNSCSGNIEMLMVPTPIIKLKSLKYRSCSEDWFDIPQMQASYELEITTVIKLNCLNLTFLEISSDFESTDLLLEAVESCRNLETLKFKFQENHKHIPIDGSIQRVRRGFLELQKSDIEAIVSLPRLKSLDIFCEMADDAILPLARCKTLTDLVLSRTKIKRAFHFPVNLVHLYLWRPSREVINGIFENCPNISNLYVRLDEADCGSRDVIAISLKNKRQY